MQPKVTKIKAQRRRGRYNVYLNGRYAFPISEDVLIHYRIFKGKVVSPELKNKLIQADQIAKLYSRAVSFLEHHLRTEREIRRKLRKWTDDQPKITRVIDKLKRLNLVDDQNYADCYVRTVVREQKYGPQVIKRKLSLKGVANDQIAGALTNFYPPRAVLKNAVRQAKRQFRHYYRDAFRRRIQKLRTNLARKGYPFDVISSAIAQADFRVDPKQQENLLNQRARLAWRRYRNRNRQQRCFKTKRYLFRQGFSIDQINPILNKIADQNR